MNPQEALPECAGWFGKIPSLGDFATRRLPLSFVEPWDEWLSAELSEARLVLADAWAEIYGHAPTWCFSLATGAIDDHAWHGILVPSCDRVGRQFPLTIALAPRRHVEATFGRQWWAGLAAIGRRALEPACGPDGLDEDLALFISKQSQSVGPAEPDVGRMESALATLGDGSCAWWSGSTEDPADAVPSIFGGLPRGECFRELLCAR